MVITDRYDHLIDDKNRLAIPSQIRNAMDPEVDGTAFYVFPEGRYLQLIPEKLFQKLSSNVTAGLAMTPEAAKARRLVFAMASRLEPDKQGRVMIPERFLADGKNRDPFTEAILGREVTLVGANDRIELWNRNDFLSHMRELYADRGSLQAAMQTVFSAPVSPAVG
jgi:MraZ protein